MTHHHLQLLPKAVCLLVKNEQGKFLGCSRKNNPNEWGFPGGKVDPGESVIDALCREVQEETGYDIRDKPLVPLYHDTAEGQFQTWVYGLRIQDLGPKGKRKEHLIQVEWKEKEVFLMGCFGAYNRKMFQAIEGILDYVVC